MDCENNLCVYWKKNECILDKISLDGIGLCRDYTQISLPEEVLQAGRESFLERVDGYSPE